MLPQYSITAHPQGIHWTHNFNIICKEVHSYSWTIKEAMFICVNDRTLKRNLGKYQLLHVWDNILQASPMLQLKPSSLPSSTNPLPYQYITPTLAHTQPPYLQTPTPDVGHVVFLVSNKFRD